MDNLHKSYKAEDRSYLALLKKDIHAKAAEIFKSPSRLGEVDIIVAEMASNLVKYATNGEILTKLLENGQGIEIISIDQGPGMQDATRLMVDGVSTSRTLGQGLGAIQRLCDFFQIYSVKGWGTIIVTRIFVPGFVVDHKKLRFEVRSLLVPKPGETFCGDNFLFKSSGDNLLLFLGDGLGHGEEAGKAVHAAITHSDWKVDNFLPDMIRQTHLATKKTRGLVGTIGRYDAAGKKWELCGIGNILTRVVHPLFTKSYLPYNGVIGMNIPTTINNQDIEVDGAHMMIMCSDGMKTRWDLAKYPNISRYDPTVIAAALYKDHCRKTDDTSVVIVKIF